MAQPGSSGRDPRSTQDATDSSPAVNSRGGKKQPKSIRKVLTGRIEKAARGSPLTPVDKLKLLPLLHDSKLNRKERKEEAARYNEMQTEKALYPGAAEWHPDEDRLFEILYMRQYSPLIPSHWEMDLSGIPIPEILFQTSDVDNPVIYSDSGNDYVGE
jgi:hypothetical protein